MLIVIMYADDRDHHMYVVAQSIKMPRKASSILVEDNVFFRPTKKSFSNYTIIITEVITSHALSDIT